MILSYSNTECSDDILEPGRLLLTTEHSPCSFIIDSSVPAARLAAIWKRPLQSVKTSADLSNEAIAQQSL
jgi:hypothetical protein